MKMLSTCLVVDSHNILAHIHVSPGRSLPNWADGNIDQLCDMPTSSKNSDICFHCLNLKTLLFTFVQFFFFSFPV